MTVEDKYNNLKKIIKDMKSVVIGFSGGVDSTLLAKICKDELGKNAVCITLNEAFHSKSEIQESKQLAKLIGIEQIIITAELVNESFIKDNPKDRCYYCKYAVFSKIKEIAKKRNIKYVVDGSNVDDINDYRPGMRAVKELKIISPLKQAGLNKIEIRKLSKQLELPTWNKPAFACLASRIPYEEKITKGKLMMIEKSEEYLRSIGFNQFRVRHHGNIARIEVEPQERQKFFNMELLNQIDEKIKGYGFKYVTIDIMGYQMGSMNKNLL